MSAGHWSWIGRGGLVASLLWGSLPAGADELPPPLEAPRQEKPLTGSGLEPPQAGGPARQPVSEGGEGLLPDKKGFQVRPFGRVYARMRADERDDFARSLSIPSARVGLAASLSHVDAEVTADLSSKSMLKDAFLRIASDSKQLRLYGGQFKAPFLQRELDSSWALPVVRRGLLANYLEDTNKLGGRRLGLMGEVNVKQAWRLRVSGGVFEGSKDASGTRLGEDASLRVTVRPFKRLTLGASSYLTEVFSGTRHHALAANAAWRLGGLELSGELVNGRIAPGPFRGGLALASYVLPVGLEGWALQPLAGAELLQLTGPLQARGYALVGGVNILYSQHFKAQFQAEHALRPGDELAGLEFSMQLATRF
ncbi:hypothetical protein [Melittangium boletus]|uniref:hypothetical protein n=1 Tax=Melittangium boletus TaxID=83453 RepID=UPI003DA5E667